MGNFGPVVRSEIIMCDNCGGHGYMALSVIAPRDSLTLKPNMTDCPRCNGTGRIVVITETTVKPYVPYTTH